MQVNKVELLPKKKKKSTVEHGIGRFDLGDELIALHGHNLIT